MTEPIAHLTVPLVPVAHGFRPVLDRWRHLKLARGNSPSHERDLDVYQAAVAAYGRAWLADRFGDWPHYDQPVTLAAVFRVPRPTTYRAGEVWHRTGRPGDLTTLVRAVEDALSGILYRDDGHVSTHHTWKIVTDVSPVADIWVGHADNESAVLALALERLPANRRTHEKAGRHR